MRNCPRFRVLSVLLLLSFPPLLQAQIAHLVRDLDAGGFSAPIDAYPNHLLAARGKLFFQAEEPSTGGEIWVSDGTSAGTQLVADSCTDSCEDGDAVIVGTAGDFVFWRSGNGRLWRSDGTRPGSQPLRQDVLTVGKPSQGAVFAALGGVLFFSRCVPTGCELWRSDGSESGTQTIEPIVDGDLNLQLLGSAAGRLFLASGLSPNARLWISDGTPAGTTLVRPITNLPRLAAVTPGRIFLVLPADGGKTELWASDGTATGTALLATFPQPEGNGGTISWLKVAGDRAYFTADDLTHGQEIWRSDGTPQGTERVTNFGFFAPFGNGLEPDQLEPLGNQIVFFASDGLSNRKLWAAQSATTPPIPLSEVCGDCQSFSSFHLARVGNRVVFPGFDAAHGVELWTTDGTAGGTARLTDVCPGPCDAFEDFEGDLVGGAGAAFIPLFDGSSRMLWRTDGTPQGTRPFAMASSYGTEFVAAGGKTFFSATNHYGWELWASDGTAVESEPVTDIAAGASGSILSLLSPLGDRLAFLAEGQDHGVWVSGGTAETTVGLDTSPFGFPRIANLTVAGGKIFYFQGDYPDLQLWASDGTPGGAIQVTAFPADESLIAGPILVEHQGRALFPVGGHGTTEIWASDGTPAGTGLSFALPAQMSGVRYLQPLGDRIFLLDGGFGPRPWLSDGTTAGTHQLSDQSLDGSYKPEAVRLGALIFFAVNHLWRSDGTAAGTFQVTPIDFYNGAGAHALTVFQNGLYFLAAAPGGQSLWRSDGTVAGTVVVKPFAAASSLIQAGGKLYLAADDGVHGLELWSSDGTGSGTVLVRDILPGVAGSRPSSLCAAAGRVYFSANDGLHGYELWTTDGTAAGTRLVQDVAPEGLSSFPQQLTLAGDNLYFTADDGRTGVELWALPLGAGAGGCTPTSTSLCLSGGRYRVEALWRDPAGNTGSGQAVPLTADTGYFWFFGPENVEAIVKVLDGRSLNDHVWVFYGALSNVEYSLTVTDTQTGLTRRYFNPQGSFASVGDTQGFGPLGAYDRKATAPVGAPLPAATERSDPAAATGSCTPGATRLCLSGGRFAVEAAWKDFSGRTGTGTAVGLTGDTGYFWFFGASNVETVIKVLDGRPVNGNFWVFYGALSNVEYTLTVTDTATGTVRTYNNPLGRFASAGDTSAFH